jgi:hypothetical protein
MASFFAWAAAPREPITQRTITSAAIALASIATLLSVVQMIQYWLRIVPFSDTTWDQYRDLFLRLR